MMDDDNPNEGLTDDEIAANWAAMLEDEEPLDQDDTDKLFDTESLSEDSDEGAFTNDDVKVESVELEEIEPEVTGADPKVRMILDVPVHMTMEVGSTDIPIRQLLQLNQGSVIELGREAGEPLDVMINGTLIAHGEVVVVNDKYGIRLTDVITQRERIERLRK